MYEILPEIFTLSNGMRVVYLHANAQVAHLGVTVLAGSRFEQPHENGLAHFLEHCIFKGTSNRKTFHVLSRLDSVGGELNAYTAKEELCVYASFSKEHIVRASELLSDIMLNSNFPDKEIKKEKEIIIDEINSYLDSPSDKIFDDFEAMIFKGHALGNNILGTRESVQSFTREHLMEFMKRSFTADNMVISFVGDISKHRLERMLESHFGACASGKHMHTPELFEPLPPFHKRSKEANYQVHAIIGGMAPGYKDDERRGMALLTNILGGPALNSRLNLSIREKYGYSYNVEAGYTSYADTGYWSVYFGTDQKYVDKSMSLVQKELRLLCDKRLGVLQLNQAKEQLKGYLALSLDSNSGLMLGLGKSLLLFDQIDTIAEICDGIDELTSSQLLEIANQFFAIEHCSDLVFDLQDGD